MDFIDRIRELASRAPKQLDYCLTEEATKTALVMPFINALGYNVFDPREVIPEFVADIGIKKGEKIDYAIFQNGAPIIFFECKWSGADLNQVHASQLYRYFAAVQNVRFGILTNGIVYRFFSDLDSPNRMDDKPFFEFNLLDFQDRHVEELKKFGKSTFQLEEILTTANELKYTAAISRIIAREFEEPSENFVRFFATQVYSGRMTQAAREQFADITKRALNRFVNDKVNERLTSALKSPPIEERLPAQQEEVKEEEGSDRKKEITTTPLEIEAYFAVKSILRDVVELRRVVMRDTKSYCGILLDNNNRHPICRFYFNNRERLQLGTFDKDRVETKISINGVDDVYQYTDALVTRTKLYIGNE